MAEPVSNSANATSSASDSRASESIDTSNATTSTASVPSTTPRRVQDYFTPAGIEEGKRYGLVRVPVNPREFVTLDRKLVPIFGNPPPDQPFPHEMTHSYEDRRMLRPLTLRYQSDNEDDYIDEKDKHDEVTSAIWDYLREMCPHAPAAHVQPAIVFQPGEFLAIDVTFRPGSEDVFEYAKGNLVMVQVEAEADVCNKGRIMHFDLEVWSNSLAPDIMPIDIVQLPRREIKDPELFASLQDMVGKVGKLVGAALEMHGPLREHQTTIYSNVMRLYVKLSKKSMGLEYRELLQHLPTRLRWRGFRYVLQYSGRSSHTERLSKDYPLDAADSGEEEAAETSAATASPTLDSSSSNPSDASGAANKKRKSGET